MKHNKKRSNKKGEKGMALVESIPVLFAVVILFNFSLGFFGAIHSGILNSIASYNYTLETFRFRSNLMYFRPGADPKQNYLVAGNRVHGTIQDGNIFEERRGIWPVTVRSISFTPITLLRDDTGANVAEADHHFAAAASGNSTWNVIYDAVFPGQTAYNPGSSSDIQVPEIWVKTVYGICLNADCKAPGS